MKLNENLMNFLNELDKKYGIEYIKYHKETNEGITIILENYEIVINAYGTAYYINGVRTPEEVKKIKKWAVWQKTIEGIHSPDIVKKYENGKIILIVHDEFYSRANDEEDFDYIEPVTTYYDTVIVEDSKVLLDIINKYFAGRNGITGDMDIYNKEIIER